MKPDRSLDARRPRQRGFTLLEVLVVISIITFLMSVLVVAFTGVRKRAINDKTKAIVESVGAAMAQYFMYFHRWPPDSHPIGDLTDIEGGESLVYYLMTSFRLKETRDAVAATAPEKAAVMVLADRDAGPFLTIEKELVKDLDGDDFPSLIDPYGFELKYDEGPDPADFNNEPVNENSYNLWSIGANSIDEKGDGDDVANWRD